MYMNVWNICISRCEKLSLTYGLSYRHSILIKRKYAFLSHKLYNKWDSKQQQLKKILMCQKEKKALMQAKLRANFSQKQFNSVFVSNKNNHQN